MFANFIYFIIALLILSLYEVPDELPLSLARALILFAASTLAFILYTWAQFQRLAQRMSVESLSYLDQRFDQLSMRHAILALILFAVDVWWLHLPSFMDPLPVFTVLPTLKSLIMLMLFVAYLTVLWFFSYDAHQRIYKTEIARRTYVYGNVAFSIPILIPWTLLFGIKDIVRLLPFELPKRILDSNVGETTYFLVFLVITAIVAPLLVQRFWRCRPLEDGQHRSRIEALCRRAGVKIADIVHWPIFGGRIITAGVMGLVSRFRYIMVTDALLQILTPDEIDQVIAHEIGHVKHRHLLLYLVFFIGFMVVSTIVFFISNYLIFFSKPVLMLIIKLDLKIEMVRFFVLASLLILSIVFYFRYLFGYFMRNFERQADAFVFQLYPTAEPLISTFDKIVASSGQPADKPNWHHFSIQQRIDFLKRCQLSTQWIKRHNDKVKRSISIFLVGIVVLTISSFQLNKLVAGQISRYVNVAYIEAYLDQKLEKTPEDAALYWLIGNAYFGEMNLAKAASAYEASLVLSPDNPDTLNNLAWLLATSEDHALRNPQRALQLAQRAIRIKKSPYIWDTLAESLFINGRIEEAIEAEMQALAMNPDDRKIYEDRLQRFKDALRN